MTDSIARNIVSQLGDLYMGFTHPATTDRADFVKYRQATNDQADALVEALLREYGPTLHVFKYRAVVRDDDPYYVTRWDLALDYEVVAANVKEAQEKLAVLLGDAPQGGHWVARLQSTRDIRIRTEGS
jgi:hypothetical protein